MDATDTNQNYDLETCSGLTCSMSGRSRLHLGDGGNVGKNVHTWSISDQSRYHGHVSFEFQALVGNGMQAEIGGVEAGVSARTAVTLVVLVRFVVDNPSN